MSQGLTVMQLRLVHEVCELFVSVTDTKENSWQGGTVYFGSRHQGVSPGHWLLCF